MKQAIFLILILSLASFASAQTIVELFSADAYPASIPVSGLPSACYATNPSFPNQPIGCQESEFGGIQNIYGNPDGYGFTVGYAPMAPGQIQFSGFIPNNPQTLYCGYYNEWCDGPTTPGVPSGTQYLWELACGETIYSNFPGSFSYQTLANKAFLAKVDCSQITIAGQTVAGTCRATKCQSIDADIMVKKFEVYQSGPYGVGLEATLFNLGATTFQNGTITQFITSNGGAPYAVNVTTPVIGGSNVVVSTSIQGISPGMYTAQVIADATGLISPEVNPSNNQASATFTILGPIGPLPGIFTISPYQLPLNANLSTIYLFGENLYQSGASVSIDSGVFVLPLDISGIDPSVTFSPAQIAALGIGTHTLQVTASNGVSNIYPFTIV